MRLIILAIGIIIAFQGVQLGVYLHTISSTFEISGEYITMVFKPSKGVETFVTVLLTALTIVGVRRGANAVDNTVILGQNATVWDALGAAFTAFSAAVVFGYADQLAYGGTRLWPWEWGYVFAWILWIGLIPTIAVAWRTILPIK